MLEKINFSACHQVRFSVLRELVVLTKMKNVRWKIWVLRMVSSPAFWRKKLEDQSA